MRSHLERLKSQWRLSTDEQVLERGLGSRETKMPEVEDRTVGEHGLSPEVSEVVMQLREATKPLRGKSMQELKDAIHEQAILEAGNGLA